MFSARYNSVIAVSIKKKTSEWLLALPTAGVEPGPPAQQASMLSNTPLPLYFVVTVVKILLDLSRVSSN